MPTAPAKGASETGSPSRQRSTDAHEKRLKLLKARAAEASRILRFKKGEAHRAARLSTLRKLLDVVSFMTCRLEDRRSCNKHRACQFEHAHIETGLLFL